MGGGKQDKAGGFNEDTASSFSSSGSESVCST